MRKISALLTAALICTAILCGCSGTNEKADGKLTVYATVYPVYDFANKIGGEYAEVISAAPKGAEPHDYEPTAQDMIAFCEADLLIYNGAGFEHWIDKVRETLKDSNVIFVNTSDGADLISEGSALDPHIWLDPCIAKIQMQNIAEAFCAADPENSDYYKSNLEKYTEQINQLDESFKDAAAKLPQKNIITSHCAFGYMCREYGFNQISAEGSSAGSEPSPSDMAKIVDFANENKIKTVFYADGESTSTAEAIAKEINGDYRPLYSIERLSDEQEQSGSDYFSLMNENLETLKEVLK